MGLTKPIIQLNKEDVRASKRQHQKEDWISQTLKTLNKFTFDPLVRSLLVDYLGMLADTHSLLPQKAMYEQFSNLISVNNIALQAKIVNDTISSGWKNLRYCIDKMKSDGIISDIKTQPLTDQEKQEMYESKEDWF